MKECLRSGRLKVLRPIYVGCSETGRTRLQGARRGQKLMWILSVYVLIVVVSESIVVAIGLVLDRIFPALSLPVSLSLFFAVLWFGWILAVRLTEPKAAKRPKHAV
jgi:hypothetical protein